MKLTGFGFVVSFLLTSTVQAGNLLPNAEIHRIVNRIVDVAGMASLPPFTAELAEAAGLGPGVRNAIRERRQAIGCPSHLAKANLLGAVQTVRALPNLVQGYLRDVFEENTVPNLGMVTIAKAAFNESDSDLPQLTFAPTAERQQAIASLFETLVESMRSEIGFLDTPSVHVKRLQQIDRHLFVLEADLTLGSRTVSLEVPHFAIQRPMTANYDLASFLATAVTHYEHLKRNALLEREISLLRSLLGSAAKSEDPSLSAVLTPLLRTLEKVQNLREGSVAQKNGRQLRGLCWVKTQLLSRFQDKLKEVYQEPPNRPGSEIQAIRLTRPGRPYSLPWNYSADPQYLSPQKMPNYTEAWLKDRGPALNPDLAYLYPWASGYGGQIGEAMAALFQLAFSVPPPVVRE